MNHNPITVHCNPPSLVQEERLNAQLHEMQSDLDQANGANNASTRRCRELEEIVAGLERQLAGVRVELEDAGGNMTHFQSEIEAAIQHEGQLEERCRHLEQELQQTKALLVASEQSVGERGTELVERSGQFEFEIEALAPTHRTVTHC